MKKIILRLLFLSLLPFSSLSAEELSLNTADYSASLREVVTLINTNDYQKAFKRLQKINDSKKNNPSYYYLRGLLLRHLQQYDKAENSLKKSLGFKGSKSDVIAELAFCYLAKKQYDKAEVALNEALWFDNLKRYPKAELLYQLGVVYQGRGKKDKAANYYREAIKADAGYPEASLKLADLVFASNDRRQAVSILRGALEKAPDNSQVRVKYAEFLTTNVNSLTNADSIKLAYDVIDPLVSDGSCGGTHIRTCVKVLLLNGKNEEAEKLVANAKQKNPKNPELDRLSRQLEAENEAKTVTPVEEKTTFKVKKKKSSHKKRKRR